MGIQLSALRSRRRWNNQPVSWVFLDATLMRDSRRITHISVCYTKHPHCTARMSHARTHPDSFIRSALSSRRKTWYFYYFQPQMHFSNAVPCQAKHQTCHLAWQQCVCVGRTMSYFASQARIIRLSAKIGYFHWKENDRSLPSSGWQCKHTGGHIVSHKTNKNVWRKITKNWQVAEAYSFVVVVFIHFGLDEHIRCQCGSQPATQSGIVMTVSLWRLMFLTAVNIGLGPEHIVCSTRQNKLRCISLPPRRSLVRRTAQMSTHTKKQGIYFT